MSIARTRERIEKLVLQDDAKVITISGLWGAGKTHIWHSIKK
jgi:methylmalonyl-CoA mutase cobalamin-binding subunit